MTIKKNQTQDKQYQIPMIATDEVIRDFGIKSQDIIWQCIGNRKYRVVMVDATEAQYKAYMTSVWAETKCEDWDGCCMVKGKSGKLINCQESDKCEHCKMASEACQEKNKTTSLSFLVDEGEEPMAEV